MSSRVRSLPARAALIALALLLVVSVVVAQVSDQDGDFVEDAYDNCPTVWNGGQENQDGDRLGDACDPYPDLDLRIWADIEPWELAGEAATVTTGWSSHSECCRESSPASGRRSRRRPRGLYRSGAGRLLDGTGTNRALVEFVDGVVVLEVRDTTAERIRLGGEDSAGLGITFEDAVVEDFESTPGGLMENGYWEWGIPVRGPAAAASGERVWAAWLSGDYPSPAGRGCIQRASISRRRDR